MPRIQLKDINVRSDSEYEITRYKIHVDRDLACSLRTTQTTDSYEIDANDRALLFKTELIIGNEDHPEHLAITLENNDFSNERFLQTIMSMSVGDEAEVVIPNRLYSEIVDFRIKEYQLGLYEKYDRTFDRYADYRDGSGISTPESFRNLEKSPLFDQIGISQGTLKHPLFTGRIWCDPKSDHTVFPYYNEKGLSGLRTQSSMKDYTFNREGFNPSLWCSNIPKDVEAIVFTDSPMDALCHYEIYRGKNTAYFALDNTVLMSDHKEKEAQTLVKKVMEKYSDAQITIAFDHSRHGVEHSQRITANAKAIGRVVVKDYPKGNSLTWSDELHVITNGQQLKSSRSLA